jgi:hypothetical protein
MTRHNHAPIADAALADPAGVTLTFDGPDAKAASRRFQIGFASFAARTTGYTGLSTRRRPLDPLGEVWAVEIIHANTLLAGLKITSTSTGAPVKLGD